MDDKPYDGLQSKSRTLQLRDSTLKALTLLRRKLTHQQVAGNTRNAVAYSTVGNCSLLVDLADLGWLVCGLDKLSLDLTPRKAPTLHEITVKHPLFLTIRDVVINLCEKV